MRRHLVGLLVIIFAACTGSASISQTVLTVAAASGGVEKTLTLEQMLEIDQTEIRTSNEFVDGEKTFSGPMMRDVLRRFNIRDASFVRLTAANDYQVEIAVQEFNDYDVILALEVDGVALSRRDKGPLWLIYPMSDHDELQDPVYNSRLIWQVVRLEYW